MRSLLTLSIGLAENFALLLSLTFVYGLLWRYVSWRRFRIRSLITGSLFGIIAILGMLAPIRVGPGVIVDGRVVIVALAGAFNGPAAAATAATLVSAYRLWLGGAGALPGVGAILTAMALGAFVHRRWAGQVRRFGPRKFLLLGAVLTVSGLLWTLTPPDADLRWRVLALLAPSVGIFFPLETLLLGLLLSNFHEERERRTLTEFSIDQSAAAIFWVTPTGKLARFNPAAARLCGVPRGELLSMRVQKAKTAPLDAYQTLTAREREVLHLAAAGHTSPEIGKRLFISPRTVEAHRANLMRKLGLRTQTDLVRYAMRRGIVPADD